MRKKNKYDDTVTLAQLDWGGSFIDLLDRAQTCLAYSMGTTEARWASLRYLSLEALSDLRRAYGSHEETVTFWAIFQDSLGSLLGASKSERQQDSTR